MNDEEKSKRQGKIKPSGGIFITEGGGVGVGIELGRAVP
jgi:hypothetical protein